MLVLVLLGVTAVVLGRIQRFMLFPRSLVRADPRAGEGISGLARLHVDRGQGDVEAWLLPGHGVTAERPGPLVIFAHGNAELIEHWPPVMEAYRRMGMSVLLPEYRGYGRSAGDPSEAAITEDFVAFYDEAIERPEVDATRVVFHGRSLGGGAVCALARHRRPRALILMSTFSSVADVARGYLMPRFLVLDPFDNEEVVRGLDVPTMVVHGTRDTIIPPEHGERLGRAAGVPVVRYHAGHNDCPPDWADFFLRARAFLEEHGVLAISS